MLIIQNENSDILRYLLSLQRNRREAMQSNLEYHGFGLRYRDPAKDFPLLRGFAFIAFPRLTGRDGNETPRPVFTKWECMGKSQDLSLDASTAGKIPKTRQQVRDSSS